MGPQIRIVLAQAGYDEFDPLRFATGPVRFMNGPSQLLSHSLGPFRLGMALTSQIRILKGAKWAFLVLEWALSYLG